MMRKVLGTLLILSGVAGAEPRYSSQLDEITLGRARDEVRDMAKREGIESETADLLLKIDVFATSNDTGCPGVDVDIINATSHTVWNVEAKIEQKEGTNDRTDKVHLPYMLPNTKARINVSCLQDYSYRSSYDYSGGGGGISLTYSAQGSKNIDEALPLMLEQKVDYTTLGRQVSPSVDGTGNLLTEALKMDDPSVAKELVLGIARTGVGAKELGEALSADGTGAVADEVVLAMAKLPPAQQAQIARTLLASEAALRWADKLNPMIDSKLCTGNRADVVGLWILAQGSDGIPVKEFRDKISVKCKPTKADGPGITAALEKDPKRAGAVLDAVDDDLFASAVASWTKLKAPAVSSSLTAYLRDGQKPQRFDAAIKAMRTDMRDEVLDEVIHTPDGAGAAHKAEWVTKQFDDIAKQGMDLERLVTSATKSMTTGEVKAAVMRDAIKGLAKLDPKAVEDVMVAQAQSSSKVFDATKLQEAGLDMAEFLAFNSSLPDCTATLDRLKECADAIAAYKDKRLQKAAGTAVKSEFLTSVRELVSNQHDPRELIPIAASLSQAGFDTGFIAERACRDADDAVRWENDPSAALELAEQISPGAQCIKDVNSKVSGNHRKAIMLGILGMLCLIAPLPAGWLFIKRRYKKMQAELPKQAKEDAVAGAKLEDRLGPNVLGRSLANAINDAKRELAGTPAAQLLEGVDESVVNATSSTVRRAVRSADVATLLVRHAGTNSPYRGTNAATYIVALPVRHARPQIAQRYLSAPWDEHITSIQRSVGGPVLALVVMCSPDAREATVLVGFDDGQQSSEPEAMLDAKDARDRGANKFSSVMTLSEKGA